MSFRLSAFLVVLAVASAAPVAAQATQPLELTRLTLPIVIDGVPDEPAWRQVAPLPLTMYTPVFRGTPTQRTAIRVAYDDEFFYAAGWFYDSDAPGGVRINSLYRDRWNGDDAFAIYIDAFNDKRNAKWFGTTPGGIRFDQLVSDDGATLNESWDTFWTAETTVTDSGWFAEVRIPFSTLGFDVDENGRAVMGLTVTRLVSRIQERVTFPEIDPKFEFRRPSVARDVVLRDVRTRKPVYVTPYVLMGHARHAVSPGTPDFRNDRDQPRELGLDVRYPLSPALTLDLTANTDFAQVEADDQQVNLDRFPLFYPERRRFFQEGSGVFDFAMGSNTRLFNSRRIGLTADGTPIPVLGGARLVGRAGGWDVGFLEMQTDQLGIYPTENFGVVRFRRPVLNQWSTVGFMGTSYVGGARQNVALGADGSLRVQGDNYLTVKWAADIDDDERPGTDLGSRSIVDARWERRTARGLAYSFFGTHAGRDFRPELAFMQRTNFTTANFVTNWYFFTDKHRVLRRVYPGALAFSTWRNTDRTLESGQYAVWVQWDTKSGGGGWIEPKLFLENVLTPFNIGGKVDIPAGAYDFADLQLYLSMATGRRLRTSLDARAGTYFDGTRAQAILTPTWNVSPHLELGGEYRMTSLRFPSRDQSADLHVARLRIGTALNAQASGNAFVQYNSTTGSLDLNLRLRYAFAEGTDLWLVYNEGLDTDRPDAIVGVPQSPLSLSRALMVKYTHTLGF
jgi:hypothetical protein